MTISPAVAAAAPGTSPVTRAGQAEAYGPIADILARRRSGIIGQAQAILELVSGAGLAMCDAARLVVADRPVPGTANSR